MAKSHIPFLFKSYPIEIDWNKIIADALWSYAKKIRLLDSITSKSNLTEEHVEVLDNEIKAALLKNA